MPHPLFLLFILDIIIILSLGFYNSYLLLLVILPWTIILFIAFTLKGLTFSGEDPIHRYSGRLYWVGRRSFQATMVASLNLILTALIIPDNTIAAFDQQFGTFSSVLLLILLPMPGYFLFVLKGKDRDRLYDLIYRNMTVIEEVPFFTVLTNELITNIQKYSDEYFEQINKIRESAYDYLSEQYPNVSIFVDHTQPYHLNLENLALFLTKKTLTPDNLIGGIKNDS